MVESRRGALFGIGAYVIWGLVPLYWPLLDGAGALELLAHRILWSLVFVAILLAVRKNVGWWTSFRARPRSLGWLSLASVLVGANWGLFIWATVSGHIVEASLGYFINPLVSVLLGVLVLRERLRPVQWVAIGVATVAVLVLAVDYGRPPWVSLGLAFSFGFYGLCKKRAAVGAVEGLTVETAILVPVALGYVVWLQISGSAMFGHAGVANMLLFAAAGLITAIPLLLFAGAANRVPLTVIGLLQYIAPTLQFLIGVLLFHEPMPASRLAGFGLVWLALAIFTVDGLIRVHRVHRARVSNSQRSRSVSPKAAR